MKNSLPLGSLGLLVSGGGVGKTYFLLSLAISISSGISFLDDLWEIGENGKVFAVFGEDSDIALHHRVRAIASSLCPPHLYPDWWNAIINSLDENLFIHNGVGRDTRLVEMKNGNLEKSGNYNDLIQIVSGIENLKLIVLDPFARFYAGDEINSVQMTFFASLAERLALETGATVIISHHVNKGAGMKKGKETMFQEAARGGTGFTNAARWQCNLALMEEYEIKKIGGDVKHASDYIVGKVVKKNMGKQEGYFYLKRGPEGVLQRFKPSSSKNTEGDLDQLVLECIINKLAELEKAGIYKTRRSFSGEYASQWHGYGKPKVRRVIDEAIINKTLFLIERKNDQNRKLEYLSTTPPRDTEVCQPTGNESIGSSVMSVLPNLSMN